MSQTKDVCAEVILLNFANCWELLLDIAVYLRIFSTFRQGLSKKQWDTIFLYSIDLHRIEFRASQRNLELRGKFEDTHEILIHALADNHRTLHQKQYVTQLWTQWQIIELVAQWWLWKNTHNILICINKYICYIIFTFKI